MGEWNKGPWDNALEVVERTSYYNRSTLFYWCISCIILLEKKKKERKENKKKEKGKKEPWVGKMEY